MLRDSRGWLVALAVVVIAVVAAVVWFATRPRPEPPRVAPDETAPVPFRYSEIAVKSPDLEVGLAEIRGAISPTYMTWRITMDCAEPEGCTGELAVDVRYRVDNESRRIVLINRCEAALGDELRFEGLQDSSTPIDRIEGLSLDVRDRRGFDQGPIEVPL